MPKPNLEVRVAKLETQMEEVLRKPALRLKTDRGVCALGVEPSEACTSGSLGKFQSGCHGHACLAANSVYYKDYRERKKAEAAANAKKTVPARKPAPPKVSKVETATKRPVKRAKSVEPAPAKRTIKRKG